MMKTYKNPFLLENQWSENECGDPFIMRFNGLYYLYCSSQGAYIKCWSSQDLVDFCYEGSVCDDPEITGAYAPEVSYYKGKFYMITSPKGNGHYLLQAEKPTGPFTLISDNYGLQIDGSIFTDDDGSRYMLHAGHKGIEIHKLSADDRIDVNGETIHEAFLNYWTEGPMIIKRDGYYYLTYTGNHLLSKGYRVAYSVSKETPDHGYVNLKNRTILLETGPEFHALGHSSSFLAPDLESYCIAYHSFDLDRTPRKRSMNIDRLFFNGARMYCNPVWWEQTAPKMPDYYGWGREALTETAFKQFTLLHVPEITPVVYTAELNVNPKGKGVVFIYSLTGDNYGSISFDEGSVYQIQENKKVIQTGKYNDAVSFDANLTLRLVKQNDSTIELYLNQMFLCSYQTRLGEGFLGIEKCDAHEIGYTAVSSCTEEKGDNLAAKAVPGHFDAIHCVESMERVGFLDAGLPVYSGCLQKDRNYTYKINVKKTAEYKVFARVHSSIDKLELTAAVNGNAAKMCGSLTGVSDEEGYEMVSLGRLYLPQGLQRMSLEAKSDGIIVDYFDIVESYDLEICDVIKDGYLVNDKLRILGHKNDTSMRHKYSGFTCSENHGMAFIGEDGMTDYTISAVIRMNSRNTGDVSVYVRATKESWYEAQVKEALFGYRVQVTLDGIRLFREKYDESLSAYYSFKEAKRAKFNLEIRVQQSEIMVYADRRLIIDYKDPEAYLYGKAGMEATGEGFGFEAYSISC